MSTNLRKSIEQAIKNRFNEQVHIELTTPDAAFGDVSTNVALQLAKKVGQPPRQITEAIIAELHKHDLDTVRDITIAGPGFINFYYSDEYLWELANNHLVSDLAGKTYVVEYSCPNYFKELHAGHLYQTIVGDVLARMVEQAGAKVHRTNFGGDVGLHVAKCLYGIINHLGGELPDKLAEVDDRPAFLSKSYVFGSTEFEAGDPVAEEIRQLNKRIYTLVDQNDHDSPLAQIFWTCREWSRDYFVAFYQDLDVTPFERFYPESENTPLGLKTVRDALQKDIFKESEGAVVFEGEPHGLHTRVFITKEQLPTYETKDIGLILKEDEEFHFDHRILITGRDQLEYMRVVWRALDQIVPGVEAKMTHLTNGIIKFGDGKKMSSRLGNVTRAVDVLETVRSIVPSTNDDVRDNNIALGAVKYEFLKHRLGGDIAFDPEASVSLQGESGPYLQYALVRAKSVQQKATKKAAFSGSLSESERKLVQKLSQYRQVISKATREYMPHHVCAYLYELSQEFNRFYEKNRVIGDDSEAHRLALIDSYIKVLSHGLSLLGIPILEKM